MAAVSQGQRPRSTHSPLTHPPHTHTQSLPSCATPQRYRKDSDREALTSAVVAALRAPERAHLLPGLARFLPRDAKLAYAERIR